MPRGLLGEVRYGRHRSLLSFLASHAIPIHAIRDLDASSGTLLRLVVAIVQMAVAVVAGVLGRRALSGWSRIQRPGNTGQRELRRSALVLLAAIVGIGLREVVALIPAGILPPLIVESCILVAPLLLLASAFLLPRTEFAHSHGIRVIVDGLMITAGAATFAWYFVLGPGLSARWASPPAEVTGFAYPVLDVILVGALLVVSAKSTRLPKTLWGPLAGGMALILLANCLRQLGLQTGDVVPTDAAEIIRLVASVCLAIAALAFIHFQPDYRVLTKSAAVQARDDSAANPLAQESTHLWDTLLPYALVPVSAALAVYAWQRGLHSETTAGVLVGTGVLVALAFFRQLLAVKENLRLYEQVREAYKASIAHSARIRVLNQELKEARDLLQTKNTDLAITNLDLQAQATTDPLTGLPNHRSMVLALDHAIDQAQRYGRPCSVLFLDLDHFKALNDGCGHLAGDTVLREMVDPIVEGLRSADTAGRWGGEEFVVLLPETDIEDATIAAERIRNFVGQREFSVAGGVRLTCSIGVASYPIDATSRDGLIEAADRAMYTAKRLGRNQVRASEGPGLGDVLPGVRKVSSRDEATVWGVVEALSTIVKAHDSIVDAQSQVVSNLSIRVGTALRLSESEVRLTGLAARLHDIGMVSIPQSTLKKTTEFDSNDWSAVVAHPALGADVVTSVPALRVLAPLIRAHHERWDGTGYPDGLEGDEIPMGSRIIAACSAYSAMTRGGRRPPLRSPEEALWELYSCSGTQFDPAVVAALRQVLAEETSEPLKQAG